MAYRVRSFATMTLREVDDIFRLGRGIDRSLDIGAAPAESEDFVSNPADHDLHQPLVSIPQAEEVDNELESIR